MKASLLFGRGRGHVTVISFARACVGAIARSGGRRVGHERADRIRVDAQRGDSALHARQGARDW